MDIIKILEEYEPYNDIEKNDRKIILDFVKANDDCYLRDNKVGHLTVSCFVTNKTHDKVLMAYHNIYKSYSWLGGHLDGDKDLIHVCLKEAKEESGLSNISLVSDDFFSLEVLTVSGHYKKGKYVSSHLHMNLTYLLEASENDLLIVKEDENSALRWLKLEEIKDFVSEKWMYEYVYSKLIKKLREYNV